MMALTLRLKSSLDQRILAVKEEKGFEDRQTWALIPSGSTSCVSASVYPSVNRAGRFRGKNAALQFLRRIRDTDQRVRRAW